jgi:hypothetical protein
MRGLFASLVIAMLFMIVALVAAAFGAVGVAFIGSLLHRWFDLSQWQGTLVGLQNHPGACRADDLDGCLGRRAGAS